MISPPVSYKATVDGLGKKGNVFSFLICIEGTLVADLKPGDCITVEGVQATINKVENEYLSFELTLEQLLDTPLTEVVVGSEVTVTLG